MLLALFLFVVFGALGAFVYAFQRHLLFPSPKRNAVLASPHHRIEAVAISVNGKVLRGYLAHPIAESQAVHGLLYFNGRRENPTSIFRALAELPNHAVLCFFYDGLGLAWRKPGEAELVADSLAVMDWWIRERGMPADRISVAGRSLGSGIAVQLAATRAIRRLVLVSPYDRLISAVRAKLPGLPQGWLRDKFDSSAHIGRVSCPCLLIVGERDTTVPVEVSRALFQGWGGPLAELVVPDCGHRGLLKRADVHRALAEFLS
jgi:pimeloyl-ACP methyl ester carboxylesterase